MSERRRFACVVCDDPDMVAMFTDGHGQVACMQCGAPYALGGYNGLPRGMGPMCTLSSEVLAKARGYWSETKAKSGLGSYFGNAERDAEYRAFVEWAKAKP